MIQSSHADPRSTQRSRILALLIRARGGWVSLPEILELGIAQYNARVFELRRMGFRIENSREHRDGQHCSAFRLVAGPNPAASAPEASNNWTRLESGSLFGDLSPERYSD